MTADVLFQTIEVMLEPHFADQARVLNGTGFFIDGNLVVAVLGDELCVQLPIESDPAPTAHALLEVAGRPIPGWAVTGASDLEEATLTAWLELGLNRLGISLV